MEDDLSTLIVRYREHARESYARARNTADHDVMQFQSGRASAYECVAVDLARLVNEFGEGSAPL